MPDDDKKPKSSTGNKVTKWVKGHKWEATFIGVVVLGGAYYLYEKSKSGSSSSTAIPTAPGTVSDQSSAPGGTWPGGLGMQPGSGAGGGGNGAALASLFGQLDKDIQGLTAQLQATPPGSTPPPGTTPPGTTPPGTTPPGTTPPSTGTTPNTTATYASTYVAPTSSYTPPGFSAPAPGTAPSEDLGSGAVTAAPTASVAATEFGSSAPAPATDPFSSGFDVSPTGSLAFQAPQYSLATSFNPATARSGGYSYINSQGQEQTYVPGQSHLAPNTPLYTEG